MLRTLIVDDEPVARRRLRTLLRDARDVEVVGECEDGPSAVEAIRLTRPDLVFLDVQMPGMDGFAVIDALDPSPSAVLPVIVFVTAFDQYALKAFDAHAVDYLLKPFERARLTQALDRARAFAISRGDLPARLLAAVAQVQAARPPGRLAVKAGEQLSFVRTDLVDWIEAEGHYVRLHVGRASHLVRDTLTRLALTLDRERFVRIHRSTLVNVDRIKTIQPSFHGEWLVTLQDGTRLQCSRRYAQQLQEHLQGGA